MPLNKLYLELTDRCNLQCVTCYRQSWHVPPADMPDRLYRALMEEIEAHPGIRTLVIGGIGEPSCSPVFSETLRRLSDRELILTSNGEFDPALVPDVCATTATVVFSMDGLPQTHAQIRGTPPDRLIDNLARIRAFRQKTGTGPQLHLQCVLSSDTLPDALPLVDLAARLGADGLIFSHLMPQTQDSAEKILYSPQRGESTLDKLFDTMRIHALRRGLRLSLPPLALKTERFCSFIEENAAFVCASGSVTPCYRLSHDCTEFVFGRGKTVCAHAFGSLETSSLMDIWEDPAYHLFRQRVFGGRYPSCPDCDLVDGCEYVASSEADCWCTTPSCADCLWSRRLIQCP